MNYWVVKGQAYNKLEKLVRQGRSDRWRTQQPPKRWQKGDRVFVWASSPGLRFVGLAEITSTEAGLDQDGAQLYRLRYVSNYLPDSHHLTEWRKDKFLAGANFTKAAVAQGIQPLLPEHAARVMARLRSLHSEIRGTWPDLTDTPLAHSPPEVAEDENELLLVAPEGRLVLRQHLRRERDPVLREAKRKDALRKNRSLACEVCGFDFVAVYGPIGDGFCEVHHIRALGEADGEVHTRLSDLAIVCSNCHRMIHRQRPMLNIQELRKRLRR